MRVGVAAALLFSFVIGAGGQAVDLDPGVRAVLVRYLRFVSSDFADLRAGKVVKHSTDAPAPGEVAVAGAVRIHAAKDVFLARARDIVKFKRGPEVLQIGRFSTPPVPQDLASLTIDSNDFDPSDCRVGDCDVRLPADVIRKLPQQADPVAFFRQVLLDNVIAYEKGTTAGRILEYDDGEQPIRPVEEFDGVLRDAPSLGALVPALPDHFRRYPASPIPGAEDFLYWSKEKFGIAPFITVTHVTVVCPASHTCVMATRDVYSSRYIDASLSVTVATDAIGDPTSFYLIFANRSRANALKGGFAGLRRALAGRRARASLEENLKRVRTDLESGLAPR